MFNWLRRKKSPPLPEPVTPRMTPPVFRSPKHPISWWDDKPPSRSFSAQREDACGVCEGDILIGNMIGYVSVRYTRSGDGWREFHHRTVCCSYCHAWAVQNGDPTLPYQRPRRQEW